MYFYVHKCFLLAAIAASLYDDKKPLPAAAAAATAAAGSSIFTERCAFSDALCLQTFFSRLKLYTRSLHHKGGQSAWQKTMHCVW